MVEIEKWFPKITEALVQENLAGWNILLYVKMGFDELDTSLHFVGESLSTIKQKFVFFFCFMSIHLLCFLMGTHVLQ